MTGRRLLAILGVIALVGGVVYAYAINKTQNPPAADLMEPDEYRRLLSIALKFEAHDGEYQMQDLGSGDHSGGDLPVTPHPSGPAFGEGVKVAMTDAEFFQFYQAYQSPKHP